MGIKSFKNKATEDVNYGRVTKDTMRLIPVVLHEKAQVKLARVSAATCLSDISNLPGNRFERLKGDRKGQCSIRIYDKYRICFTWQDNQAVEVEIVDYH